MLNDLESQKSQSMNGKTCLICFDKDSDAIFMDCGHGGVCYTCAMEIWKSSNDYVSDWGLCEIYPWALSHVFGKVHFDKTFYWSNEANYSNPLLADEQRVLGMYNEKKLKKVLKRLEEFDC